MTDARSSKPPQGVAWVAGQFAIMLALLAAGPLWRGQWPGKVAPGIGAALVVAGAWLGIAGVRLLGINRTPFPEPKPGSQLVTAGIYARVRHPLYASVIALGFGWALLWCSGPALALAVAQTIFFYAKARFEERLLRERFAKYVDYARRVPRFLPRLFSKTTQPDSRS
ncbi:MAG TPA: isoprenylcysteine carboxylmethyltransferase family protein [Chthoniobacteraceae bacterium]|nr:isoprenylcysteine carboxylmethyltransferase family protein [Chthoniobacteraceae bacterium]